MANENNNGLEGQVENKEEAEEFLKSTDEAQEKWKKNWDKEQAKKNK